MARFERLVKRHKRGAEQGICWGAKEDLAGQKKDYKNEATGQYLFLQLKSGDSYLKPRKDGTEIFEIPKDRHVDYWMNHIGNVMLVIRRSNGEILWMEIKEYLRKEVEAGRRPKRIVFKGEVFSRESILAWRNLILEKIR